MTSARDRDSVQLFDNCFRNTKEWRAVGPAMDNRDIVMTDFELDPRTTALINVDMQNCFVRDSPVAARDGMTIIPRVNAIADAVRRSGGHVVHTMHVLRPDGSTVGIMGEFSPPVKEGLLFKGNPAAELHSGIVVTEADTILEKPRFGAFYGTDLDLILKNRGIESVIVTGIATNVCCETTAREAAMRDLQVFFVRDATATFDLPTATAETIQTTVCATLARAFAQVETTEAILAKLMKSRRSRA